MRIVKGSRGVAPRFVITIGLREGYGPTAKNHNLDDVVAIIEKFLKGCAANGQPYLTGSVTTGTVVYAWPEGQGKSGGGNEPQATYSGEVNPLYNSSMSQVAIEEFLNALASRLGEALGQTRIYIAFNRTHFFFKTSPRLLFQLIIKIFFVYIHHILIISHSAVVNYSAIFITKILYATTRSTSLL